MQVDHIARQNKICVATYANNCYAFFEPSISIPVNHLFIHCVSIYMCVEYDIEGGVHGSAQDTQASHGGEAQC